MIIIKSTTVRASRIAKAYSSSLAVSGLLFGVVTAVPAADWQFHPSIDFGATRDDNLELATGDHPSTSGYVVAARLEAEGKTELSSAKIRGAISRTNYQRTDVEDRSEQSVFFNGEHRTSERGKLGLDGEYRRDPLFENARIEPGTGNVRDVDVGLTTRTEVQRNYRMLQPTWNWLLTELSSVRFAYRMTDASFSNAASTSLVDYQEKLASATYTRHLSPIYDFDITANLARYEPDRADTRSDTKQLLAGVTRAFSENTKGSIAFGVSRTTETVPGAEDTSGGTVAAATWRQSSDYSSLEGIISRDITPSGIGRTVLSDQVRVYWTRKLASELDFVMDFQLLRNRALEGTNSDIDRRYYEISPELRWRWLENVSLVGSFRHRKQKYDAQSESADSNAVFLGVSYSL